jgi:hypothetical protein
MPCGYDRVLTLDQDQSVQFDALTAAGCTVTRSKEVSRITTDGVRSSLLKFMHEGEVITLVRSVRDRQNIIAGRNKGSAR